MGEILALTWAGVDLFRRTVTVFRVQERRTADHPGQSRPSRLLNSKYASTFRRRPIWCFIAKPTRARWEQHPTSLNSALKTAKIHDLHFHDLRHTFATRMVQAGVDLYKVQRLLGHKSPIMTQRYAHHYPESLAGWGGSVGCAAIV